MIARRALTLNYSTLIIKLFMNRNIKDANHIIVVLGMHRSGTSAITRGLLSLGVDLGNNLNPPSQEINEKGFWEDIDILQLNISILNELAHSWFSLMPIPFAGPGSQVFDKYEQQAISILKTKFQSKTLFGVKDPRFCILLSFWQPIFQSLNLRVSYIIANRNPLNIAMSLKKRDGIELGHSYYLWLRYITLCFIESTCHSKLIVDYDILLDDPQNELNRIALYLGIEFNHKNPDIVEYINIFLERRLCHNKYQDKDLENNLLVPKDILASYNLLKSLAKDKLIETANAREEFIDLSKKLDLFIPLFNCIDKYFEHGNARLVNCQTQLAETNKLVIDRDLQLEEVTQQLCLRDQQLAEAAELVRLRDEHLAEANGLVTERDLQLTEVTQQLCLRDQQLVEAAELVRLRDEHLAEAYTRVSQLDQQLAESTTLVCLRDSQLTDATDRVMQLEQQLAEATALVLIRDQQLLDTKKQI